VREAPAEAQEAQFVIARYFDSAAAEAAEAAVRAATTADEVFRAAMSDPRVQAADRVAVDPVGPDATYVVKKDGSIVGKYADDPERPAFQDRTADELLAGNGFHDPQAKLEELLKKAHKAKDPALAAKYRRWLTSEPAAERRAVIIMGPPAAGKSTVADPIAAERRAVVPDSDEAKHRIEEFQGGFNASGVHEESAIIANKLLLAKATARGLNIVLPVVGKSQESVDHYIESLVSEGYTIELLINEVPATTSLKRAYNRFLKASRYVSFKYIASVGTAPSEVFHATKNRPEIAGYARYNSDTPEGSGPELLESGGTVLRLGGTGGASGRGAGRSDSHREGEDAQAGRHALNLFGEEDAPAPKKDAPPPQESLFDAPTPARGMTAALQQARQTVSFLEGKVARGAATADQIVRYQEARALLRRTEGMDRTDVARVSRETEAKPDPGTKDTGDLFAGRLSPLATDALPDVRRRSRTGEHEKDAPNRDQAIKALARALGVPIRTGRMWIKGKGTVGEYDSKAGVVRIKTAGDLEAVAHEIGHHLHALLFGTNAKGELTTAPLREWRAELLPLAIGTKSTTEGAAEFWRRYLTNPDAAAKKAPLFHAHVEKMLEVDPQAATALELFREQVRLHQEASPEARVAAQISTQEDPTHWSIRDAWHRFRANVIDDADPVVRLVETIAEQRPELQSTAENIERMLRLYHGAAGTAEHWIENAPLDFNTLKPVAGMKPLREILEPLGDQLAAFRHYAVARRALELDKRGIETGIDPADAQAVVRQYRGEETLETAFDELQGYQDALLQYLLDAGVMSKDTYAAIKKHNREYVPFYRVMDDAAKKGNVGSGVFGHVFNPVHKIKGSGRTIIDPIESIIKNTYAYMQLAARQQVSTALAELSDKLGTGEWIRQIPAPMRAQQFKVEELRKQLGGMVDEETIKSLKAGARDELLTVFRPGDYFGKENVISIVKDGKRQWYEVDEELFAVLTSLEKEQANAFVKLLSLPARTLRAGAILAPEFMLRNPARDQVMAFVQSEYNFKPGVDWTRGLFHILGKTETYWEWMAGGGARAAMVDLDRNSLQKSIRELAKSDQSSIPNVIRDPLEILRVLSALTEDATRVGEFSKAKKIEGDDKEALQLAAAASREVNLDYQRKGLKTAALRQMAAFWNARLQGYDKLFQTFKEHPTRSLARSFVGVTLPSALLYLVNRDDDEYWEIPQWQRDLFWLVKVGDTWVRVPKPFELGIVFGTVPERIFEWMDNKDPEGLKVALENLATREVAGTFLPIPTAIMPLAENYFNYSVFLDRPVVPRHLEGVEPREQSTARTSEVAKGLGRWLNYSPSKIDNVLRGYTGGLGRVGTEAVDAAVRATGPEQPPRPAEGLQHRLPGVRGFTVREPGASSESAERFYRRLEESTRAKKTTDLYKREGRWEDYDRYADRKEEQLAAHPSRQRVADRISELRGQQRMIEQDPEMGAELKRREIDDIGKMIMELARDGAERRIRQ
jgi:hypothetical protein